MEFKQAERLVDVPVSKTREMFRKCAELTAAGVEVTALTLGEPDFDTPQYIKDACKKAIDEGFTKYAENTGINPLKQAICSKLEKENNLHYELNEIGVTTGVAQGMFVSLLAFLNPGDEVLVPDPVYVTYSTIPAIARATVKKYTLASENNFQVDAKEVECLITEKTKMIVIVSPNNPTGSILNNDSLEKMATIAKKHNLLVVSDEIYERLTYGENRVCTSIASLPGMKERTIILNGLSKSMAMTGWRLGYIAAPENLLEPMNRLGFYMTAGCVSFVQKAAVAALQDEDGSVERMRLEFEKRRNYLVGEINKMKHFKCLMPDGAFYIFMDIRGTGMSSEEFCNFALDNYRLATIPGNAFGDMGEGFVRMSYATSMQILEKAVSLLNQIDKDLK